MCGESSQPRAALWSAPTVPPSLDRGAVHVWRAGLVCDAAELARLEALLSDDERARAARFQVPAPRQQFAATRGILRLLLGRYLQQPPERLRFQVGPHGKPFLVRDGGPDLQFNVSHTEGMALFAFTWGRDVGVDLERHRPVPSSEQIAERFFSPTEAAILRSLPPDEHIAHFFRCWVRKEAFVKAVGQGISLGLNHFEVLGPESGRIVLHDPDSAGPWGLQPLEPGEGYAGAVAARGTDWAAECWQWAGLDTVAR